MGFRTSVAKRLRYAADARTPQHPATTLLLNPGKRSTVRKRPENSAERSRGCSGAAMRRPGIRGAAEALCYAGTAISVEPCSSAEQLTFRNQF